MKSVADKMANSVKVRFKVSDVLKWTILREE